MSSQLASFTELQRFREAFEPLVDASWSVGDLSGGTELRRQPSARCTKSLASDSASVEAQVQGLAERLRPWASRIVLLGGSWSRELAIVLRNTMERPAWDTCASDLVFLSPLGASLDIDLPCRAD